MTLAAARSALARVFAGAGLVVELTGEPGIGRTHLLDAIAAEAGARAAVRRGAAAGPDASGAELAAALGDATVPALLAGRSDRRPLVLLLDDLQWADAATHHLLAGLVAAPRVPGVLVVLSRRSPSARVAWADGVDERWTLPPLSVAEAAPLLAGLPPERAAAVHRRAGGNPFLLTHLAAAADDGVPAAVVEEIRAEVESLPPTARRWVRTAAVIGEPVDPDLLDAVAEGGLDPAGHGLLVADAAGLRFRRPVVGEAVYAGTGPAWRLAAHERVAGALQARGASAARVAPHLELSARAGDVDAAAVLVEAGAAEPVVTTAARWYAAAVRLLPDETPQRSAAVVAHAIAIGRSGRLGEARQALRSAGSTDADAVRMLAELDRLLGGPDHGTGSPGLHLVRADRLSDAWAGPADHAAALHHAVEALVGGDARVAAEARVAVAAAELACGRTPVVDGPVDDTVELLERLSRLELGAERLAEATRHARCGVAAAERTGQPLAAARVHATLATCLLRSGRLAEARAAADAARVALAGVHPPPARDVARTTAVALRVAVATGDRASTDARIAELDAGPCPPRVALELAAARPERAAALLVDGPGLPGLARIDRPRAYALLAAADPDRAPEWVARAELAARGVDLPGRQAQVLRARAELHLSTGRVADAVADARAALAACAHLPADAGLSGLLLGRALAAAGDPAAAKEAWEAARPLLAGSAADACAHLLRSVGARPTGPRTAAKTGGDPLSRRERQVAELVGAQLTNREIAAALFLSEKTVETHLAAVFRKLGVRSRTAVAAHLRRP
ncbi:LuxR C-terminal-related transcriptional regulator [Pseudonocardia sp. CA-107938]|uniref:helix-turn-helix transcriptional regulator n=1 Tax=Pseudonocardia sp. CA-107938 TaxID=3240021 RepID=UPI003D94C7B2